MRTKPFWLFLVLSLLLNLALAACSDSAAIPTPTVASGGNKGQVTGTAASVAESSPTPATANSFRADKNFIFGLTLEPVAFGAIGLDPANLTDHSSLQITRQLYETLYEYKSGTMQPQLASYIKPDGIQVSDDGLTYDIRIGGGLKFSDGSDFTTSSIKFNLQRWANTANIYHKGDFWAYRYYFVEQQGYSGFPGIIDLDKLKVIDNREIQIVLKKPMPDLPQILAMPQFGMVAPSSFDNKGNFIKPVGSGPYMQDKAYDKNMRSDQRYMSLKKNPNFEVERDPNKLPKRNLDSIVLKVLPGNTDGLRELREGRISATDKIKPEDVTANLNNESFEIKFRPALNLAYLGLNQARSPFDREEVRLALAYAIDTKTLVNDYYQTLGIPATGLIPPATTGYPIDSRPFQYNPQKARELLSQAGFIDGIQTPIELWVMPVTRLYYPDAAKIADGIIANLAKINVTVVKRDESWVSFNSNRDEGRYQMFLGGWQGENGAPDEFYHRLFGEENKSLGYSNNELQGYINSARRESDPAQRLQFYHLAAGVLVRDTPLIPLAYVEWPVAVRRDIQGFVPSPDGLENWATLSFK